MATIVVTGILVGWFETGMEGIVWALQTEDASYEGLFVIDEGDYLTIKSPSGELLFEGIIDPDTEIGKLPRPFSNILQPCAQGRWVHWTQRGYQPDDWGKLFFNEVNVGTLVKVSD